MIISNRIEYKRYMVITLIMHYPSATSTPNYIQVFISHWFVKIISNLDTYFAKSSAGNYGAI